MKAGLINTIIFTGCFLLSTMVSAGETLVKKFAVEPDTAYRLSFKADSDSSDARWFLRIRSRSNELPVSGCYQYAWQKITPGEKTYNHLLSTTHEAHELSFGIKSPDDKVKISEVSLTKITPDKLLINWDFSAGPDNYSGWNETYNVKLVPSGSGNALHLNNNGYALSDPIPVAGGGKYEFSSGSSRPTNLLVLDKNLHLEQVINPDYKKPVMQLPENAAYVRFFYKTWFDHIPVYREITIKKAGLRKVDDTPRRLTEFPRFAGEIILGANSDPRELRAARELQYWIGRISGKDIPVLAEPSSTPRDKFFIGSRWAKKYKSDLQYLKDSDGYAVRRDGNQIYIFGAEPRGTLFGIYALLEKNSDIIWPRPNPEMNAVFTKQPDLKFTKTDFRSRPVFKVRMLQFSGGHEKQAHYHQDWTGRNGCNTPFKFDRGFKYLQWRQGALLGHGGFMISNFLGLKDKDLAIYPMIDGKRMVNRWRQPCYSNPAVPEKIAVKARQMLQCVPGKKIEYFNINIGDNWGVCSCSECMKPIKLADGSVLTPKSPKSTIDPLFFSTRHFMMLNKVAEALAKDYPDLKIDTHAYIFTAEPPKVKINSTIVPEFAAYPTSNEMYPIMEQNTVQSKIWSRRLKQWMRNYDNCLGCFGYYYPDGFNLIADTAAADYRALADNKPYQVHTEGMYFDYDERLTNWDADACEKWIIAKLMWDPHQDPEKLREVYISRTYESAAPEMRKFYALLRNAWELQKKRKLFINCHTPSSTMFEKFIVDSGIEKPARKLLVQASQKAKNPVSKRIIDRMLARFDFYAKSLNRNNLPLVEEAGAEWSDFASTHWEKALVFNKFKVLPDWRAVKKGTPAKHYTEAALMHDGKNIYIRITAGTRNPPANISLAMNVFPKGDRVAIVFRSGNKYYYYAVGADGGAYAVENWGANHSWKSTWQIKHKILKDAWGVTLKIPMSELNLNPDNADVDIKLSRTVAAGTAAFENSTFNGRSIFNNKKLLRTPLIINSK